VELEEMSDSTPATDSDGQAERQEPPPIPPSIELAWGLRDRGTRGPKPGLTLEKIVAAAIKVAHTHGLGALSMARVASELGVGTMSLYRYVAAKDELLALMVDSALGTPPEIDHLEEGWRAGLARWAVGVRDAYRRHPWSLRVPISGPPLGPNNVAWLEQALRSLAGTPLSEQEKLSCILLVSGFVRNDATLTADFAAAGSDEPGSPRYGALLSHLIDPGGFPALQQAVVSGALDDEDDIDGEFDFGLERILAGIDALIRQREQSPAPYLRPGGE
jgi:AcrR family transcriptional regulator